MKLHPIKKLSFVLIIALITVACENYQDQFKNKESISGIHSEMSTGDLNAGGNYAASSWPAPHRDVRNSDYTPFYTSADVEFAWNKLEHAGFFISPTIGPEGNVYMVTGYGAGYSNLICYNRFGNKLWESDKLIEGKELEGVDYGCEINAPLIDAHGNVYQADWNQLWSFTNTGDLRWVSNLREHGIEGMFISPFFTNEGYIGGSTTDGYITLFDMQTGELVFDKLKLPGTKGPASLPMLENLWETQMCPEVRQFAWDAVFGCNMQCSNTPAMDPEKGRIFVVANGYSEDEGVIHRVDITPDGLELIYTTSTGFGGSGTSPTLTFDGRTVLFTDGNGFFNGVDTESGEIRWRRDTKSVTGVSSTTTPEGLAINYSFNFITAYDAYSGELMWKADLDSLVADKEMRGLVALQSTPSGLVASSIMATPDKIWMIVLSCAKMPLSEKQQERNTQSALPVKGMPKDSVRIPQSYYLCSFDYKGNLLSKTPAPGDGAMLTAGIDGRLYISGLSVYSDVVYNQTPWYVRTTPVPTAGFWGYKPVLFKVHAAEALLFLSRYFDEASARGNFLHLTDDQKENIALEQLKGIELALLQSEVRGEMNKVKLDDLIKQLSEISRMIQNADHAEINASIKKCYSSLVW